MRADLDDAGAFCDAWSALREREVKLMRAPGFRPTAPWTAQDIAEHAALAHSA
ncbi:MAG TPA: hypothetical protein VFE13_16405 [Caulobacteraceae bacterium]|nr:hypothetical protein [Caulobacteraceae bacterium]